MRHIASRHTALSRPRRTLVVHGGSQSFRTLSLPANRVPSTVARVLQRILAVASLAAASLALAPAAYSAPAAAGPVAAADPATAQTCAAAKGCEAKFCRIQAELDQAQAAGNARRADGLRTALAEARANCTDAGLRADREAAIKDAEEEVREREEELKEAQADGRSRKIEKAQRKLEEARAELETARRLPQ